MSCTQLCPVKGVKVTPVVAGGLTFCVCGVNWLRFNSGPGTVHLDFDEQLNTLKNPHAPYTKLWFRCGDFDGLTEMPAWKLDALVGYSEPNAIDPMSKHWQVGFIQTVDSLEWEATYDENWNRKAMANSARDSASAKITAPWYGPPHSDSEPVLLANAGKNHPMHSDDPQIQLSVNHPDASCRQLQYVTLKGTFNLWLIARDPATPLDASHVTFLWHAAITIERAWELPYGKDPLQIWEWKASGTQKKTNIGPGKGSEVPVLDNPIANLQLLNIVTDKKGKPCPAPAKAK